MPVLGTLVQGRVVDGIPWRYDKHQEDSLKYVFSINGERHESSATVTHATFDAHFDAKEHPVGEKAIAVRVFAVGSWVHSELVEGEVVPWAEWNVGGLFGAFGTILCFVTWRSLLTIPWKVCRHGVQTTGVITQIDPGSHPLGGGLEYTYQDMRGTPRTGKMTTDNTLCHGEVVGQSIRVLYLPNKMSRSIAYDFCLFRIIPSRSPHDRV